MAVFLERLCVMVILPVMAIALGSRGMNAAQETTEAAPTKPKDIEATTLHFRVGMRITTEEGPIRQLVAACPVPMDWPEQKVRLVEEHQPGNVRVRFRTLEGTARQLVVTASQIPAKQAVEVIHIYEVTRYAQRAPDERDGWHVPAKLPPPLGEYRRPSPGIESSHTEIVNLSDRLADDDRAPWQQVQTYYDWTRENIQYVNGALKGAVAAIRDKNGDCEELTSVFIALCRAQGIPARTVWVPGHCWAEFYLEDSEGQGHWVAADLTGPRQFGHVLNMQPILQKGDRFPSPQRGGKTLRYVAPWVKGVGSQPRVEFIEEVIAADEPKQGRQ